MLRLLLTGELCLCLIIWAPIVTDCRGRHMLVALTQRLDLLDRGLGRPLCLAGLLDGGLDHLLRLTDLLVGELSRSLHLAELLGGGLIASPAL